ncbi:thioredoxin [Spirosoma sp. KCTC 42546]|uniref:thioredoxin n=1 Tax=Spirosoma sp. KCTC 42546 TaxID=2520506 RepID=UPI0011585E50|nr:thioredoxin [Spirosoma sp. KCTC 42546]QDK82161.1 thioredoxin [Spirosoma sp. KCTC 42546]
MTPHSSLLTDAPQRPVLLIFTSASPAQRVEIDQLLEKARFILNPAVRVMRVSESTHPEVVHSFGFTSLPAFALVRQGQELWRYSGPVDSPDLFNQMEQTFLRN